MSIYSEYDRNVLVHYGVKGMKWGIRKSNSESESANLKETKETKQNKEIKETMITGKKALNNSDIKRILKNKVSSLSNYKRKADEVVKNIYIPLAATGSLAIALPHIIKAL